MSALFNTIDTANRRFEELFNAGQLDDLARLYSPAGKLFPPDKNSYEGRERIKAFWQGARDAGVANLRLTTGTVVQAGDDCLIETSSYQHSLDRGNFQVIWRRAEDNKDQWQLDIDIFN